MNYKIINNAIVRSEDIPTTLSKDKKFYRYLLDNNVAYYYLKLLCKRKSKHEKDIIQAGNRFNTKYLKTLRLIIEVSKKFDMDFLLFKTFKHVPEAVDGDIDLFIKGKDFSKFLRLMEEEGFICSEDEKLKASCNKSGFCKIEPRVNISFHGKIILGEDSIWRDTDEAHIDKLRCKMTTKELDIFFFLLNVLYGPNYFKLYQYLLFKNADSKKIYSLASDDIIRQDLEVLVHNLTPIDILDKRFPLFPNNIIFGKWWLERILPNSQITLSIKIKHLLFFLYAKYGYKFFNNLPFRHDWGINYA